VAVLVVLVVVLAVSATGVAVGAVAGSSYDTGGSLSAVDDSTLNGTTNDTTTDGTLTNDTTENTTDTVDDTTDDTTDTVNDTTDDATNTTTSTTGNTTETVTGTTEKTTDAVNATLDADGYLAGSLLDPVDADLSLGDATADADAASATDDSGATDDAAADAGSDATTDRAAVTSSTGDGAGASDAGRPSQPADPAGISDLGVGLAAAVTGLLQTVAAGGIGPLDRLWRFASAFRYSRHDASDPLEHDGRRAVYDEIEATPGVYLSKVAERADVPLSTTRHHVRVLADENLVTSAKIRGKRRYFPVEPDADSVELQSALSEQATARVLEALADLGPTPVGRLADELDRDPSTVSHHLDRLADDGLVERERDGRAVMNRLAPAAERAFGAQTDARATPPADD
jgi:DNA-binding transcriptional ArsR family regulator